MSKTHKPKKKLKIFKVFLIVVIVAAAGFGASYAFIPGVKEKVDEKIVEIIYNTIGPGRLVKNEMVTDMRFDELKGTLYFTPVEGIKDYFAGVKNLTNGEEFTYHTYSAGYASVRNMEEFRTGDLLEFYVITQGDGIKTDSSDRALLQYTIQDMDNIIYRNIGEVFYKKIRNYSTKNIEIELVSSNINSIEQKSSEVIITELVIDRLGRPNNVIHTIDINKLDPTLNTNLEDLRAFKNFVYKINNKKDNYSEQTSIVSTHTNMNDSLQGERLFADLEADGYTANQLQFSNGEVNSYEQNKVEVKYSALYRAVHPTLKPITFRQTHTFEMDFVADYTAPKYLKAYQEGAEAVIVSSEREVIDYSLMHHLYEMEDKVDYISFLETEKNQ